MSRTILGWLAAGVLVLQAGCLPLKTEQPLGSIEEAQVEESMVGTWKFTPPEGNPLYLHVGLSQGGEHEKLMSYVTAVVDENGKLSTSSRTFYVVEIAGRKYAHLLDPHAVVDGQLHLAAGEGYDLYRIEVEGDLLRMFAIDRDSIAKLIDDGQLAGVVGRVERGGTTRVDSVRVTDTTENLRAFVEAGGELFSNENVIEFGRVPN